MQSSTLQLCRSDYQPFIHLVTQVFPGNEGKYAWQKQAQQTSKLLKEKLLNLGYVASSTFLYF